jgi:DNA-binding CsgD family transcriptional regulator
MAQALGFRVASAAGVQAEMEVAFAGVHQLCVPLLDRLERVPEPQREALATAFGLIPGSAPDRFLVGLAVLSLLTEAADRQPLLCVVDDAQWWDVASAQALAFVARRLGQESVAVLFAARERSEALAGITELVLEGLDDTDARALLDSVVTVPLDPRVRDQIVAETHGNPLALLTYEELTPAELAGGFGLPVAQPLSGRIERVFQRRLEALPLATRRLLLVAAAEPVGDPTLLWRAAERLGISTECAAPAVSSGWLDIGARVTFRHPLVRSAVYGMASPDVLRAVHWALAEATDPQLDPDRRAWQHAQARSGPDENVAAELERLAGRAEARGGMAAAAAFLNRSAELTLDPARRAQRALAAARAEHLAGAPQAALELLAAIEPGLLDPLQRARCHELRAQVAFATSRGRDAPPLLLEAAKQLEPLDIRLARETYLDALGAGLFVGRLAEGEGLVDVARAVASAPPAPEPPRTSDLLLDGLAALVTKGWDEATPTLRLALERFLDEEISEQTTIRWLWLAGHVSGLLWDYAAGDETSGRHLQSTRDSGGLAVLPVAFSRRISFLAVTGQLAAARSLLQEAETVAKATGNDLASYVALVPAAVGGREADTLELIRTSTKDALQRGEGLALTLVGWAQALLYNSLGRYHEALAAATRAAEGPPAELFSTWSLVELIEAATRAGTPGLATDALGNLTASTTASGSDWALGVLARSSALMSAGAAAEALYDEAISRLEHTPLVPELARARLLYGEWLRREQRRLDAREQLRAAHELFVSIGMQAFEDRAARELLATGETARKRAIETSEDLTPQEAQIAKLASEGLSNPEISGRLFISRRTVEYHLHKVFIKLDITSRNQLHRALSCERGAPRPNHGRSVVRA